MTKKLETPARNIIKSSCLLELLKKFQMFPKISGNLKYILVK